MGFTNNCGSIDYVMKIPINYEQLSSEEYHSYCKQFTISDIMHSFHPIVVQFSVFVSLD